MTKKFFIVPLLVLGLFSCKKEDTDFVKIREYSEVAPENDAQIQQYLKSHFYDETSEEIKEITSNQTPLSEKVRSQILKIRDAKGELVNHTLYYLITREGTGQKATVADSSFVVYKGFNLKNKVFDQNQNITLTNWMDLLGSRTQGNSGVVAGFRYAVSLLKDSSVGITQNADGTLSKPTDYGKGIFFLPSGLAYFSSSVGGEAYSPLIFEIGLIKTKNADHDRDKIPTIQEISFDEQTGVITFTDCNENGVADYLETLKCN